MSPRRVNSNRLARLIRNRAAIEALSVPASFTTAVTSRMEEQRPKKGQVVGPQGVEMVGPWGLEPQTSTVSR